MILFASCSKNYLHRTYCYLCCARASNSVNIILVLLHSCVRRQNEIVFRGCQDGSSVCQKLCKCVRLMYLLINYIDLVYLSLVQPLSDFIHLCQTNLQTR